MTNVEALKNLYVALGGSAEDVANLDSNAAIINILGNVAGGGGGASGLVVTGAESEESVVLDKTWKEIRDTFAAAKPVVIVAGGFVDAVVQTAYDMSEDLGHQYAVKTSDTDFYAASESSYPTVLL